MTERISVAVLAKELGTNINGVYKLAAAVGLRRTSGGATFAPAEAERVRQQSRRESDARLARPHPMRRTVPRPLAPATRPASQPVAGSNRCGCCGASRSGTTRPGDGLTWICGECQGHVALAGESLERKLARLENHDARLQLDRERLSQANEDLRDAVRDALRTRNSWRRTLTRVALAHEATGAGGCRCGAKSYPCFTVKQLEVINPGIARQVERFGTMTDEELDDLLDE